MKKIFLLFYWMTLLLVGGVAHAAWDATIPADNEYVYKVPGDIRQDWTAIATGTDAALCVTTAKVCSGTQFTNAQLAALTSSNLVDGSALYSLSSTPSGAGAFPITNGGTGATTRQGAIDALSALSLTGTSGQSLTSNGSDMIIAYPSNVTIASAAQGDILFEDSTPKVNRLGAGTSGQFLQTAGASANPAWAKVDVSNTADITGTLAIANGGTGTTSPAIVAGTNITLSGSWPNQTVNATIAPPFSTQNVVTGSRAIGSIYQNTSGKTMWVSAQVTHATAQTATAYSDSSSSPSTQVDECYPTTAASGTACTLRFMVLNNNYYEISGTVAVGFWNEWY